MDALTSVSHPFLLVLFHWLGSRKKRQLLSHSFGSLGKPQGYEWHLWNQICTVNRMTTPYWEAARLSQQPYLVGACIMTDSE